MIKKKRDEWNYHFKRDQTEFQDKRANPCCKNCKHYRFIHPNIFSTSADSGVCLRNNWKVDKNEKCPHFDVRLGRQLEYGED